MLKTPAYKPPDLFRLRFRERFLGRESLRLFWGRQMHSSLHSFLGTLVHFSTFSVVSVHLSSGITKGTVTHTSRHSCRDRSALGSLESLWAIRPFRRLPSWLAATSTPAEALVPASEASTSTEPAAPAEADKAADFENFSRAACASVLASTAAGGADGLGLAGASLGRDGSLNSGRFSCRVRPTLLAADLFFLDGQVADTWGADSTATPEVAAAAVASAAAAVAFPLVRPRSRLPLVLSPLSAA
ncbi:hypothetical protein COO60DRAFT_1558743, partial [Scenedesmus sp. NREL 46B-D3]